MKKIIIATLLSIAFCGNLFAQTDSVNAESNQLLPQNFLITQRILWGEKGLMRTMPYFALSQESRDREMTIRNTMVKSHQLLGYAALAGMIAQGFVGASLYKGNDVGDIHEGLSAFTNACYFSSLGMILFTPPPKRDREPGITQFQAHRYLSAIHITGMITTNVLAGMLENDPTLRPYHRAAAFTALATYATAIIIIKL